MRGAWSLVSIFYECPAVFPSPFIEETILSLEHIPGNLQKKSVDFMYMNLVLVLHSVPLASVLVFIPVPSCFDSSNFQVHFEERCMMPIALFLLLKSLLAT